MKLCIVCGNTENDDVKSCSNCGNNDLRTITEAKYGDGRFSGKYKLDQFEKDVLSIKLNKRKYDRYDFNKNGDLNVRRS